MKKLLLGLSCVAAMMISLNASATKKKAAQRAAKAVEGGAAALDAAGTTLKTTTRATRLKGKNAVGAGNVSKKNGTTAAAPKRVENNKQCSHRNMFDMDTASAAAAGLIVVSNCNLLSPANGVKWATSIEVAGDLYESLNVTHQSADAGQKARAENAFVNSLEETIDGVANGGPVRLAQAKKRAAEMKETCPTLNPF